MTGKLFYCQIVQYNLEGISNLTIFFNIIKITIDDTVLCIVYTSFGIFRSATNRSTDDAEHTLQTTYKHHY